MDVFEKITAMQSGKEFTDAWMVGQQLKDICRADPNCGKLIAEDLENPEMSLEKAAAKIKAKADEIHRTTKGNCVCIPPDVAEGILREFYGLPPAGETPMPTPKAEAPDILNLDDFL